MRQTRAIKKSEIKLNWYLIDATDIRLGKLAVRCADLLMGKHKVDMTKNLPSGDAVIVLNAQKVDVFAKKLAAKKYYQHSGYIGGIRKRTLADMIEKYPEEVIEKAVKGMLPKNKLGAKLFTNLHVYKTTEHPHEAQKPIKIEIK